MSLAFRFLEQRRFYMGTLNRSGSIVGADSRGAPVFLGGNEIMGERLKRNMNPVILISCVIFIMAFSATCSNPIKPDTIWDIQHENDGIWWVLSDHQTITTQYNILDYAYLTIMDSPSFEQDTTLSVTFVSAIGDTEIVRPYRLHFSVPRIAEINIGGASIYLRDLTYPLIGDHVLDVGNTASQIKAIYRHIWNGTTYSITVNITP